MPNRVRKAPSGKLAARSLLWAVLLALLLASCGKPAAGVPATPAPPSENTAATPTPSFKVGLPTPTPAGGAAPRYGGVLSLANRGDPPSGFDSMRTSSIALHQVGAALFGDGNLVKRCRENAFQVCPDLADSWFPNAAYTQWTFNIRPDVTWHDGQSLTAHDLKFWLDTAYSGVVMGEKVRAPAYFKGELGEILRVEAPQGRSLKITLARPAVYLVDALTNPRLKVSHPAHLFEPQLAKGNMSVAPLDVGLVGTGPFKFDSYSKGSLIRLARNEAYWEVDAKLRRYPYLDGINYVITPDPATMDAALRTGRLDGGARGEAHYLSVERKIGYDKSLKGTVYYGEMQGGLFRLGFNVLNKGPWQDVRVRQAVALWVDKRDAIPGALGGYGYLAPVLSPLNPMTNPEFRTWPGFDSANRERDKARTKQLLEEAGYGGGFQMSHLCRATQSNRCDFLYGQLAPLGISLKLKVVDEAEWNRARLTLEHDTEPGALFTSPVPEATESVFGRYSKAQDSYTKHEDPRVDEVYLRLANTRSPAERIVAWRAIEKYIVLEQAYIVPIAGSIQIIPYRTYVKDVPIPPEDGHANNSFASVWLDRAQGSP